MANNCIQTEVRLYGVTQVEPNSVDDMAWNKCIVYTEVNKTMINGMVKVKFNETLDFTFLKNWLDYVYGV